LDKNTHLITEVAHGAKYELAAANPQTIQVVAPSWLHTAIKLQQRPSEADHRISTHSVVAFTSNVVPATQLSGSSFLSRLENALNLSYDHQLQRRSIFQSHQFFLIGFGDENDNDTALKQTLSKLIRRGDGTIYWELNEDITMLIVCDGCDPALQQAAQIVSQNHVQLPPAVSPRWVLESYQASKLQPTPLYPPVQAVLPPPAETISKKGDPRLANTASNSTVFKGCLFSFLKTKVEDDDNNVKSGTQVLDFDVHEQAAFVKEHGGQLLSSKLVAALKADAEKARSLSDAAATTATKQRKCYVVCWGGGNPRVDTSPLVSQLQRGKLCEVILVTPLWIQTCVTVRKRVRPDRVPRILMPQAWSMKCLISKADKNNNKEGRQRRLDISLTGFQGTEKAAIIHLIGAIGGMYHDHMSKTNTHLICKEAASGIKLEKAKEWGLHVVSVEWIYHVLEHGYGGAQQEAHGCEERFSVNDNGVA
jgi:twin BRCT domain/BRCT domain, a BRCA1 C-terminus domain